MPLSPGTKLGPYEIVAPLGAGGMGEVYRAHDTRLGRDVAVKVLQESLGSGSAWERFEREARAASALNHPNICAVFDVGAADGRQYLVMELLEGKTLRDYFGRQPADSAVVITLGAQIADALEAAHAKGIIHRDIKSGNIMVTGRRHVKVLDFGLAKYASPAAPADDTRTMQSLTAAGTVMGTPHYMAPEILQGKPADARSDLWALGIVLHEMLTGRLPFQGSTAVEISSSILREAPPPLPASVPSGLRAIVGRCLAKRPEERYQNAGETRAALEALQTDSAPNRRNWLWAAGGAAALAAAGGFFALKRPSAEPAGRRLSTGGPPSANQEATDLFELAMNVQRTQNDIPRGQALLERALALDPKFAEARRYHSFNYVVLLMNGITNDRSLAYKAEEGLKIASRLEPDLESLPSAFIAVYLLQGRKDLGPLKEQALKVLEKNPGQNDTRLWWGILLWLAGDNTQARAEFNTALKREPLFGPARMFLGETARMEGDLLGAIREQLKVLEQAPGNISAIRLLAVTYMQGKELAKARALLQEKRPLFAGNYMWRGTWAMLLALEGKREEARREMDEETLKFFDAAFVVTLGVAEFYGAMGDSPKAIDWLDKAVRNGDERIEWFRKDPWLASIRQDPRFQQIIDSIEARRKQRSGK